MDNSSCWCYLCSQRVTPVLESDGGIRCPDCSDRFVEHVGGRSSNPVNRLPLWSHSLLGLVSDGFSAHNEEVGWGREGMLSGGRDRGDAVAGFALVLADYLLEGKKGDRSDRLRRLRMNKAMVCKSGEQCCICLEDFKLGEEAEETPCKHRFHGCCIDSWLKDNGTCPMCRRIILDAGEGATKRFAFTYSREGNSFQYGSRRVLSRLRGIRSYLGCWSQM